MNLASAEKAFSEFAALPYVFAKYPNLSPIARHVYYALFSKWNRLEIAHANPFQYPISDFTKDTGWDRRQIYRAKNELVEAGLISVSQSGRQATFYTLYSADEIVHSTETAPQNDICSTESVPQNDSQESSNNICSTKSVQQNDVCSTESVHIKRIEDNNGYIPQTPISSKRKKRGMVETLRIHFEDLSPKANELLATWEDHLKKCYPKNLPTNDGHLAAIKKVVQDKLASYGEDGLEDIITNSIAENRYALLGYPRKGNTGKATSKAAQKASTGYTSNGELSQEDLDYLLESMDVLKNSTGGDIL